MDLTELSSDGLGTTGRHMDVSDRLREARKLAGMRQQDLADALGVSDTTVIMWENPRYQRRIPPKR
jgi:DNA-binding XRE family transcriptional regulator